MTRCFITTVDNPYDPCDQFDQWYRFDCDHGYNSCGLLARLAYTSSQLTDNENAYEIELAIDQIIKADPLTTCTGRSKRPYPMQKMACPPRKNAR